MTLQVEASPLIIIMTTLDVSIILLENIYSKGINIDNHNAELIIVRKLQVQAAELLYNIFRVL